MARARLEVGEVRTIRYERVDHRTVRAHSRVRDSGGRVVKVQADGKNKDEAETRLRSAAHRRAFGVAEGIGPYTPLWQVVEEYITSKIEAGEIGPTSANLYRGDLRRIKGTPDDPKIGRLELHACTPVVVQGWLKAESKRAPSSAKRIKSLLNGAFALADERGVDLQRPDPVGKVKLSRPKRPTPRAVSLDDLQALRERVRAWQAGGTGKGGRPRWQHMSDAVDVMLGTGCRPGELLALRWQDVDLASDKPTVTICGTVVRTPEKGLHRQGWGKTANSYRTITVPDFTVAALMNMRVNSPGNTRGLVFTSATGGLIELNNFGRRWREIRGDEYSWVTPHSFRRTVATIIDRKAGSDIVAAVLGNTPAVAEAHYIEKMAAVAPDMTDTLDELAPDR